MDVDALRILIDANKAILSSRRTPVMSLYIQHSLTPGVRSIEDQYSDYLIRRWEVSGKQ